MGLRRRGRRALEFLAHGQDAPTKRVAELFLTLISDPTIVTVPLGGWISAMIAGVHRIPWTIVLVATVLIYAVSQRVIERIEELKRERWVPRSDIGIE